MTRERVPEATKLNSSLSTETASKKVHAKCVKRAELKGVRFSIPSNDWPGT